MIDLERFLTVNPAVTYYPEYDLHGKYEGIRALTYTGADYNGKPTKVFAQLAYPENVSAPVPAVVLVHGGGCHPDAEWIIRWTSRGYAVLAMSTTGHFPVRPGAFYCDANHDEANFIREMNADFAEDGFVPAPDNSEMLRDIGWKDEDRWMYHAISQSILAHNILRSDPKIDRNKIGICGISWGGVITSLVIGYDPRFAFAVPIYGSGALQHGLSCICDAFTRPENRGYLADDRFDRVKTPVLWLCWNDDACFSINSNSRSFLATAGNHPATRLSMKHLMMHAHTWGFNQSESIYFADAVLNQTEIPSVSADFSEQTVRYKSSQTPDAVRLFWIDEPYRYGNREKYGNQGRYMTAEWRILPLDKTEKSAKLPENFHAGYVEFTFTDGIVLCSPFYENNYKKQ